MTPRAALAAVLLLAGCSGITTVEGGVAYLEVQAPAPASLAVGGTIQLRARALDRDRQPVEGIAVRWRTPDATITLDEATGLATGASPGPARVQAYVGNNVLVSEFVNLTVTAAP